MFRRYSAPMANPVGSSKAGRKRRNGNSWGRGGVGGGQVRKNLRQWLQLKFLGFLWYRVVCLLLCFRNLCQDIVMIIGHILYLGGTCGALSQGHFYTWFHGMQDNLVRNNRGCFNQAHRLGHGWAGVTSDCWFLRSNDLFPGSRCFTITKMNSIHNSHNFITPTAVNQCVMFIGNLRKFIVTHTVTITWHRFYLLKYIIFSIRM